MSPHTAEVEPPETEQSDNSNGVAARRADADALMDVRASDLEPYIGLRYLSKLFRFMAMILVLLLVAEVITGLVNQGRAAIPTLLGEVSRLIVLAGLLWGAGDLAILMIDVGHDVRATRILTGRQIAHQVVAHGDAPSRDRERDTPSRRSEELTTR
jgi:hypothetical protein